MVVRKRDVSLGASVNRMEDRVAVPKYYYEDLPKELRSMSFYVSNLEKLREIEMVKKSLSNAIKRGESFQSWKDNLDVDAMKELSSARLEMVYRTNVNSVYNQSARFNAYHSDVTPYLMYTAVMDDRTRPDHAKLNGVIKRADSIFWDKFTPPISYNCRCGTVPLSTEDAKEMGITQRAPSDYPEPSKGFGQNKMGDTVSVVKNHTEDAINKLPTTSPYRSKFRDATSNIEKLVDIWYKKNEDIFR